jgi:hypothetical protein
MTHKYTHYTTMGATMEPDVADAEGFVVYRADFQSLPVNTWTPGERWIDEQERRIEQAR